MRNLAGPNVIEAAGMRYLLVEGAGVEHLAPEALGDPAARPAVPAARSDTFHTGAVGYDPIQLGEARWAPRTLCGRAWSFMCASDSGPLWGHERPIVAPSCRVCLRRVTRSFDPSPPDHRVGRLAWLVVDALDERGSAEVIGTPGDQIEAMRAAVRGEARRRGIRVRTIAHGEGLYILSLNAWAALSSDQEARDRAIAAAQAAFDGTTTGEPTWRFRWHDWEVW